MESLSKLIKESRTKCFYLNYGNTRKITVSASMTPTFQVLFKLTATDHKCTVKFSKTTWDEIMESVSDIREALTEEEEIEFMSNDELKVFSEMRHGKCAICFENNQGVRVNMMKKSFNVWVSKSCSISRFYEQKHKMIKNKAAAVKTFVDSLVVKCNECRIKSVPYKQHLAGIQDSIKNICDAPTPEAPKVEFCDDEDDDDDYKYKKRRYDWSDDDEINDGSDDDTDD